MEMFLWGLSGAEALILNYFLPFLLGSKYQRKVKYTAVTDFKLSGNECRFP